MVKDVGYAYENLEVETDDGYILQMSRLPNKQSLNCVYFQHGILDSCSTWITHGPAESLGFEARDGGFDVYLGNYRGVYPRKTKYDKADYWNYSVDHIAKYDIHAFMKKIFEIKVKEYLKINP
jgi:pimeloyl-ACP methyl ester carboxylesterase